MRSKTVLITGADGYIALHLANQLRNLNYNVLTARRNNNGNLRMDFSNPYEVASINSCGIDVMIHTVSPSEKLLKQDPYNALSENATGIHAALDFCVKNEIKDFIYFSSFHVFGNSVGLLTENTPVAPYNDYGLIHCISEQTVEMFERINKINAWIIRPSNIYGVPVSIEKFKRWNLIPFSFCKEAVEKYSITLQTPGYQRRNFVGISDVCKKTIWILEDRPEERIIHAYGKETMSILDFALLVQKVAKETFNLQIQVIKPEGKDESVDFEFTSFNNKKLLPTDEIEIYVRDMMNQLLTKTERTD